MSYGVAKLSNFPKGAKSGGTGSDPANRSPAPGGRGTPAKSKAVVKAAPGKRRVAGKVGIKGAGKGPGVLHEGGKGDWR